MPGDIIIVIPVGSRGGCRKSRIPILISLAGSRQLAGTENSLGLRPLTWNPWCNDIPLFPSMDDTKLLEVVKYAVQNLPV